MIANGLAAVRTRQRAVLCLGFLICVTAQTVSAADCPGHPDALGTSRTLVVDPREHPRIGTMQYPETLPLADHEVVLTFDDGPLPRYSNQILEILAAQCVKATFFTVGRQAQANPEGVRKLRTAGHTVGTHSQNHPTGMNRLPVERVRQEIDQGIASVSAALGDGAVPAPFFRIPGLSRTEATDDYAASLGLQVWSADFPADDWRHVSPSRVYDLAIRRLEAKGKGILLLHDIQPRTVAALPRILRELKVRGYRIVHVVPATVQEPPTPTGPQQWRLHPPPENVAISGWPRIPGFVFASTDALPAPALSDWDWQDGHLAAPAEKIRPRGVPLPRQAPWPRQSPVAQDNDAMALPIPSQSIFEMQEGLRAALLAAAPSSNYAEPTVPTRRGTKRLSKLTSPEDSRRANAGIGRADRVGELPNMGRSTPPAPRVQRGKSKQLVQVKKRSA